MHIAVLRVYIMLTVNIVAKMLYISKAVHGSGYQLVFTSGSRGQVATQQRTKIIYTKTTTMHKKGKRVIYNSIHHRINSGSNTVLVFI